LIARYPFDPLFEKYTDQKESTLAKPNYQFEKRQRDLAKKKKQEEKKQRKLDKSNVSPEETPNQPAEQE
jgi:hypothetical protein